MQMIVAIIGSSLIVVYVAIGNLKLRSGGYAVVMLMAVIKGYISGNFMGVA